MIKDSKISIDDKLPQYRARLRQDRADAVFIKILERLMCGELYKSSECTVAKIADEIGISNRYVSAVVANNTGGSFSSLINHFRLRDAKRMLEEKQYDKYGIEDIALMAGFSSRQAFYVAFARQAGMSPQKYRLKYRAANKE